MFERFGPVVHGLQLLRVETIQSFATVLAHRDDPDLTQDAKVLGHGGLRQANGDDQCTDGQRAAPRQQFYDLPPPWFGDRSENIGSRRGTRHVGIIFPYGNMSMSVLQFVRSARAVSLVDEYLDQGRGEGVASIRKEIVVHRSREVVWDAIRDVGAIHKRLVPGFVVDCRLEGDSRYLTFGNGMTIREIIVDVDDQNCRHVWSARGTPFTHHNASIQVFAEDDNTCRLVWIADLMPNEIASAIAEMIQQALNTMRATFEA